MVKIKPLIGQWYLDQRGTAFEVVAIDNDAGTVELQFYDGTLGEVDDERWQQYVIEEIEPPEDYSGSLDITSEDYSMHSQFIPKQNWPDPLDFIDKGYFDPQE